MAVQVSQVNWPSTQLHTPVSASHSPPYLPSTHVSPPRLHAPSGYPPQSAFDVHLGFTSHLAKHPEQLQYIKTIHGIVIDELTMLNVRAFCKIVEVLQEKNNPSGEITDSTPIGLQTAN